jgi:NADP-dependent 3-hydroxy acid dehydrogenase YdfG
VAVLGGTKADAASLLKALTAEGVTLTAADDSAADLVILLHGLGANPLRRAFDDLTRLAGRGTAPVLVVGVANTSADGAGLAGLVKTAALEWSAAWKCVTIEKGTTIAKAVAGELARGGVEREVRLGTRRAVRIRIAGAATGASRGITPGPWVVSGGARGVTATCGIELARAGARRILLLGRSRLEDEPAVCHGVADEAALKRALIASATGKPDLRAIGKQVASILGQREIRATIAAMQQAGAEVRYAAVDVASVADVAAAIADARAVWGPMKGLVHGAGVLADKRIGEKTAEQFASVLQPKLDGVRALLDACGDDALEQICFFSSVAAHSGNPGQSDYAAANSVLDQLAVDEQTRRGPACHVVSTAWGPWDGGMVTESLAKHFTARGISLIPQADGARAFVDELARGTATQVILGCGLDQVREAATERLRIDVAELPVLEGHRIEQAAVLPMTMALDALLGVGRQAVGAECEVRDLRLLQGLVLTDGHGDLDVRTSVAASGSGLLGTLTHPTGRPAYQAELVAVTNGTRPAATLLAASGAALPDACLRPYDGPLFHGPSFQVIKEVFDCTASSISARLATAGAMGWPDSWQLDPAALDGALQLLRVWGIAQDGRASLPTSIGRCRAWAPWPTGGEVGCTLQCRRDNPFKLSADALFVDLATGAPLLSLDNIVMHVHAS